MQSDINLPIQEFEPLLKEVVSAKRLSASKMTRLTDIALKSMEVRAVSRLSCERTIDIYPAILIA